jgi:hypothetical protein
VDCFTFNFSAVSFVPIYSIANTSFQSKSAATKVVAPKNSGYGRYMNYNLFQIKCQYSKTDYFIMFTTTIIVWSRVCIED